MQCKEFLKIFEKAHKKDENKNHPQCITLVFIAMHNYLYLEQTRNDTEHTVSREYLSRSLVFNNIITMSVCVCKHVSKCVQKLYDKNEIGRWEQEHVSKPMEAHFAKKAQKLHRILQKPSVFGSNPEEEDEHVTADTIPSASV